MSPNQSLQSRKWKLQMQNKYTNRCGTNPENEATFIQLLFAGLTWIKHLQLPNNYSYKNIKPLSIASAVFDVWYLPNWRLLLLTNYSAELETRNHKQCQDVANPVSKCFSMAPHIRSRRAPCSCFPKKVSLQLLSEQHISQILESRTLFQRQI